MAPRNLPYKTLALPLLTVLVLALFAPSVAALECVSPEEVFAAPQDDLNLVDLGAVRIHPAQLPRGEVALLSVQECGPRGLLGVWIPWSEASASPPAVIEMSPKLCREQAPQRVEVVLQHYAACQLTAYDDDGNAVDSASAAPTSDVQTLVLQSLTGIRRIKVTGAEICVLRVCWECEVEFPEDDCVEPGDLFTEPAEGLREVNLGWAMITPATLPSGEVVPLSVDFCTEDASTPGIFIPWSEESASPPAQILMSPNLCRGEAPQKVEVVLRHFNYCKLEGYDDGGSLVAHAEAAATSAVQTLVLQSTAGIRTITFNGSEICLVRICWECEADVPEDDCVEAGDLYSEPAADLLEVNLGWAMITPATLPSGEVVPLSVDFCTEDASTPGIFIPWSEDSATPPAQILMSPNLCLGQAPQKVEVVLRHFNYCKLEGYDDGGSLVAHAEAAATSAVQTLVLQSTAGIRTITFNGSEICLVRICWECEADVPEDDCVEAGDVYSEPAADLLEVNLGWAMITPATLPSGEVVPLSVDFCTEDASTPGIFIPWSEDSATPPAQILMSPNLCLGQAPQKVEVVLRHFNYCKLEGYDDDGNPVAGASAAPGSAVQTLVLQSPAGIRTITFNGSEICLVKICWECEAGEEPRERFRRGDSNTDGNVDISDGINVLTVLFLGTEPFSCEKAGDMNDDGEVNVSDAIYGLNSLFLGGPPIPPPFPECGPDLTPDDLSCVLYPDILCR